MAAVSTILVFAMTACAVADNAQIKIRSAISQTNDQTLQNVRYVNYTDNNSIETANGTMFTNPVLGPETFEGNLYAWGEEAGFSGVGDPFVLRHNGMYYLYCTTPGDKSGIKCFSSPDLVNWQPAGKLGNAFCTDITWAAYAPEVVYDQSSGKFYMYTAEGSEHSDHAVLVADDPAGPFTLVSWRIQGLTTHVASIDGHVFVDDDGQWYFYKAYENDIWCYKMNSPTSIDNSSGKIVVNRMNGGGFTAWTEGPFVIKHNGKYYLTYTGNHCWSEGYRINYAVSDTPWGDYCFKELGDNPLLVHQNAFQSTTVESYENYDGVGHSSTVMGPNLDSYYIVYHSIHRGVEGQRHTRIDRLAFDGESMYVLGPTSSSATPTMPQLYNYFLPDSNGNYDLSKWNTYGTVGESIMVKNGIKLNHGAKLLSKESFGYSYTAECNFMFIPDGGRAGILFSYTDDNNYGKAVFDRSAQKLIVSFVINGNETRYEKALVGWHDFGNCQTLTVKRSDNKFVFLVNGRELCNYNASLGSGSFGAVSDNDYFKIGYTAINSEVNGSSLKNEFKPVSVNKIVATDCRETDIDIISNSGKNFVSVSNNDVLNYYISVAGGSNEYVGNSGAQDILFRYISYGETKIAVYQNRNYIGTITLPNTNGEVKIEVIRNAFSLSAGCSALAFCFETSNFALSDFELDRYVPVVESNAPSGLYSDGDDIWRNWDWDCWNRCSVSTNYACKKFFGNFNYGDYEAEVHIRFVEGTNAGIIVRGTNPSANWTSDDTAGNNQAAWEGTNFYQGYYIFLMDGRVRIGKASYNWTEVASAPCDATAQWEYYRFKVRVVGATITVFINDVEYLTYTDPDPFMQGAVGIRALNTKADFVNLSIRPINDKVNN